MLAHAFNGTATRVTALWPDVEYELEEVTNASVSSYGDLVDVRRLGHRLPVAFATGAITLAGTLVCARSLDGNSPLWKLRRHEGFIRALPNANNAGRVQVNTNAEARFLAASMLPQELPEVHLLFVTETEDGLVGIERLYGVKFQSSGGTIGVDNPLEEDALQFKCRFYEQLRLHRHLSREEVNVFLKTISDPHADLRSSYWQNYHRTPSLVDGITELAQVFGARDLVEYVNAEAKEYDAQVAAGTAGSRLFADRGDTVLITVPPPAGTAPGGETTPVSAGGSAPSAPPAGPDGQNPVRTQPEAPDVSDPVGTTRVVVEPVRPMAGVTGNVTLIETLLTKQSGGTATTSEQVTIDISVVDGRVGIKNQFNDQFYSLGEFEDDATRFSATVDYNRWWGYATGFSRTQAGVSEQGSGVRAGGPPAQVRIQVVYNAAENRITATRDILVREPEISLRKTSTLSPDGQYRLQGASGQPMVATVSENGREMHLDVVGEDIEGFFTNGGLNLFQVTTTGNPPASVRYTNGNRGLDATLALVGDQYRLTIRNPSNPQFQKTSQADCRTSGSYQPFTTETQAGWRWCSAAAPANFPNGRGKFYVECVATKAGALVRTVTVYASPTGAAGSYFAYRSVPVPATATPEREFGPFQLTENRPRIRCRGPYGIVEVQVENATIEGEPSSRAVRPARLETGYILEAASGAQVRTGPAPAIRYTTAGSAVFNISVVAAAGTGVALEGTAGGTFAGAVLGFVVAGLSPSSPATLGNLYQARLEAGATSGKIKLSAAPLTGTGTTTGTT